MPHQNSALFGRGEAGPEQNLPLASGILAPQPLEGVRAPSSGRGPAEAEPPSSQGLCRVDELAMEPRSGTFCMECGHALMGPPRLREKEDGTSCATCADRLLDAAPGIFHTPWPTSRNAGATPSAQAAAPEPAGVLLRGPWSSGPSAQQS